MSQFMKAVLKADKQNKALTPAQRLTLELINVLDDSRWVSLSNDVIEGCFREALTKSLRG